MNTIYTNKYIDFTKEPIFFGSGKNSQRYDVIKYPIFDKIWEKMAGFDWSHDEVACTKDQVDFHNLPENMKFAFTRVLQKLIFLDSVQGRGLLQTIGSIITNPEFECCVTEWQRFEISRHSRSYTHILRSIYSNPSDIFDESFNIPELLSIADSISQKYEDCFEAVVKYHSDAKITDDLKLKILKMLIEINILEGVRFYSGFATIWSMHYSQGFMERSSKILQLICRDENLHLNITQNLLRILKTEVSEGFTDTYKSLENYIIERYTQVAQEEFEWIDYLFSKGSFLGMTSDLAKIYLKYLINRRLKALKEPQIFSGFNTNPIPWVNEYINMDAVLVNPQEAEILNYSQNILDLNINEEELRKLQGKLK